MLQRSAIPILMYHSVDTACDPRYQRWMVTPQLFEDHLRYLQDNGYQVLPFSAVVESYRFGRRLPTRAVALTFDDGLRDFQTGAHPLLLKFGMTATLFAVSGCIGSRSTWLWRLGEGDRPMVNWRQLADLADAGIEIGAHTVSHPQLDLVSLATAKAEIEQSKREIEDHIARPVRVFAYPHGYSTPAVRQIVRDAGFDGACRVGDAMSPVGEDPFNITRLIVSGGTTTAELHRMLAASTRISPRPDSLKVRTWRIWRMAKSLTGTL